MVSRVEWIDRNNTVYRIDYYNKYGYKYCSENVKGGNVISREFYDRNGDIKVLEQTDKIVRFIDLIRNRIFYLKENKVYFGNTNTLSKNMDCKLYEIKWYNKALSDEEIQAL